MNNLYMLTDMTGKDSQVDRTAVVWRWEVRRKYLVLTLAGLVAGLLPQVFLFFVFGTWGLLLVPIMIGVMFFIFESRRKDGLQLRQWEFIKDKMTNRHQGKIMLCGQPIVSTSTMRHVRRASRPVQRIDTESETSVFDQDIKMHHIAGAPSL